ncbi:MAG: hypothetical protein WC608_02865 [Parcubacteria group bacterium]
MILLICLLLVAIGCKGTPPKEGLKDTGLFGEHSLVRVEKFNAVGGSVSGSFFLGIGSVSGTSGMESKLRFYWSPKPGEIVPTDLPYNKLRFIIDETKNTPTVEFVFNDSWLNHGENSYREYHAGQYPNLNDLILSWRMELAKVRISSATLEKEVYLPKIH